MVVPADLLNVYRLYYEARIYAAPFRHRPGDFAFNRRFLHRPPSQDTLRDLKAAGKSYWRASDSSPQATLHAWREAHTLALASATSTDRL